MPSAGLRAGEALHNREFFAQAEGNFCGQQGIRTTHGAFHAQQLLYIDNCGDNVYIEWRNVKPRLSRMTDKPPEDRIGYSRPPVHARFKKGRSGNPGGRPRRAADLPAMIERALDRPAATAAGRRRRITRREAIVASLVEHAAAGELGATKLLLDLAEKARRAAGPDPVNQDDDDPREFLLRELARLAGAAAAPDPDAE